MSKRSHRRRKKRGPRPVSFFSTRWFEQAIVAMDHYDGFEYDGKFITVVGKYRERREEYFVDHSPPKFDRQSLVHAMVIFTLALLVLVVAAILVPRAFH